MLLLASCASTTQTLYHDASLADWTLFTDPASSTSSSNVFKAQGATIAVTGKPFGYMRTNKQYSDYVLTLEWRWTDGKGTNSGIFQRVQPGDRLWPVGVECQLQAGHAGDLLGLSGAYIAGTDSSAKFPKKPRTASTDPERPAGQWNKVEIRCVGTHITVKINGQKVNEAETKLSARLYCLAKRGRPLGIQDKTTLRPFAGNK